jgi:hypothetical protein
MLTVSLSLRWGLLLRLETEVAALEQLLLEEFSLMGTVTMVLEVLLLEESMMEMLMDSALEHRQDLASANRMVRPRLQPSLVLISRLLSLLESTSTDLEMLEVSSPLFLARLPLSSTSLTFSVPVDLVVRTHPTLLPCNLLTQNYFIKGIKSHQSDLISYLCDMSRYLYYIWKNKEIPKNQMYENTRQPEEGLSCI